MKKLIILFAVVMMTASVMAQVVNDQPIPQANKGARLERIGNTYIYAGQIMNNRQMLDWYAQQNCQAAYDRFAQGRKLATAGWSLLGIGVAMNLGAYVGYGVLRYKSGSQAPARMPAAYSQSYSRDPAYMAVVALGTVGTVCEIACIPTLIVGYNKMHTAADMYNILNANEPRPYLALQSDENGLGLALHF